MLVEVADSENLDCENRNFGIYTRFVWSGVAKYSDG